MKPLHGCVNLFEKKMFLTNIGLVLVLSIKFSQGLRLNYTIPGPKSYSDKIGIVGAGPAGIHMALLLKQKGFKSVEVLESSDRIGGKSYTIMHRDVPHEMGTCYLSPDYETNIIPLVNKYVPGDLIKLVTGSVTLDGNTPFVNFNLYAGLFVSRLINTNNQTIIRGHILNSMRTYIRLHNSLLGEYDGEIPPEPLPKVSIRKQFLGLLSKKCSHKWSVIRQKRESQNGGNKKLKHAKFSEKQTFLTP